MEGRREGGRKKKRGYIYCTNTNTLSNLPSTSYTLNRNCSFSIGVPLSSKVSALIISLRLIEPLPSSSNISKKRLAKNEDYNNKNWSLSMHRMKK